MCDEWYNLCVAIVIFWLIGSDGQIGDIIRWADLWWSYLV